ncbi:MAG: NTPase [Candidatus Bathyarchaeia archaeon]
MHKRVLLITGSPGVGKTTLLLKVVEALRAKGYSVGGMVSREVRPYGTRIGFEILDLGDNNKRGWLAHVQQEKGPRVGKYRVNLEDLNSVGVEAILRAVRKCDVIVIDEIGPMELFSKSFKLAALEALESGKLVIAVVHRKTCDKLIDYAKARKDTEIFNVTFENRDELHKVIVQKAEESLKGSEALRL